MPKRSTAVKTMQVILLIDIPKLGEKHEAVRVAPIFARNVLFPKGQAIPATKMNLHNFRKKMEAAEAKRQQRAESINDFLMKVQQDGGINFTEKVNERGTLYAKITEDNIVAKIKEVYSVELNPQNIKMKKKITESGSFQVPFQYREVKKDIVVHVKGEMDKTTAAKAEETTSAEPTETTPVDEANTEKTVEAVAA